MLLSWSRCLGFWKRNSITITRIHISLCEMVAAKILAVNSSYVSLNSVRFSCIHINRLQYISLISSRF